MACFATARYLLAQGKRVVILCPDEKPYQCNAELPYSLLDENKKDQDYRKSLSEFYPGSIEFKRQSVPELQQTFVTEIEFSGKKVAIIDIENYRNEIFYFIQERLGDDLFMNVSLESVELKKQEGHDSFSEVTFTHHGQGNGKVKKITATDGVFVFLQVAKKFYLEKVFQLKCDFKTIEEWKVLSKHEFLSVFFNRTPLLTSYPVTELEQNFVLFFIDSEFLGPEEPLSIMARYCEKELHWNRLTVRQVKQKNILTQVTATHRNQELEQTQGVSFWDYTQATSVLDLIQRIPQVFEKWLL